MSTFTALEEKPETPLLLRRIQQKPQIQSPIASGHMTIVTTQGFKPEMVDGEEDATRYDKDR